MLLKRNPQKKRKRRRRRRKRNKQTFIIILHKLIFRRLFVSFSCRNNKKPIFM